MPELKIGIQLKSLRQPFRRALETARGLGASAVEFAARSAVRPEEMTGSGLRLLRNLFEDANLTVCAALAVVYAPFAQRPQRDASVAVRASGGDPYSLADTVRAAVA